MYSFNLKTEQVFDPKKHMEKAPGRTGEGDITVACWEPGQTSPYHCHPDATEIYFCFEGGGKMRTPSDTIDVVPGRSLSIRAANCTNTSMAHNGPCCSGCATARACPAVQRNGRATPTGSPAPKTSNTLKRTRSAEKRISAAAISLGDILPLI